MLLKTILRLSTLEYLQTDQIRTILLTTLFNRHKSNTGDFVHAIDFSSSNLVFGNRVSDAQDGGLIPVQPV